MVWGGRVNSNHISTIEDEGAGRILVLSLLQPVTWLSFGFVIVAGGLVILYVRSLKREKEKRMFPAQLVLPLPDTCLASF